MGGSTKSSSATAENVSALWYHMVLDMQNSAPAFVAWRHVSRWDKNEASKCPNCGVHEQLTISIVAPTKFVAPFCRTAQGPRGVDGGHQIHPELTGWLPWYIQKQEHNKLFVDLIHLAYQGQRSVAAGGWRTLCAGEAELLEEVDHWGGCGVGVAVEFLMDGFGEAIA
eukprot:scaffold320_cov108-Skeletonema_dohrnii-CCMP3373.AAC.2